MPMPISTAIAPYDSGQPMRCAAAMMAASAISRATR
jgi:hypothetical protein